MPESKLTLDKLESWLWDSANILRGSIDSSDFKNYIFGLLFLKRSNDRFEEEVTERMVREGKEREEAEDDNYLFLPQEARWSALVEKTEKIGIALDKAFSAIEENNSFLEGVMTATKFGDTEKLSNDVLSRLLRHFNKYSLANKDLVSDDLLGDAYEYLIKQFADDAGKKGGEFYTPRGVVDLIVRLIDPHPGHSIYDPTCGSGGMLISSARYVAQQKGGMIEGQANVSLNGQEKNLGTWAIGKLNMILHNHMDAKIYKGDTLKEPKHMIKADDDESLLTFDRVIANPPFSLKEWWEPAENAAEIKVDKNGKEKKVTPNYAKVVSDKYGRLSFGVPPRGYADFAFLQHMMAVLKEDGKAGVVLPHGTLFRGSSEGKIRKAILERDWVEGIVGLPSALFYNTGIPASIWIINKSKSKDLKNKVLFIDASQDYKEGKNQNSLEACHVDKIASAYRKQEEEPKYMRVVDLSEIAENDYNLNISRYIDTSEPEPIIDLISVKKKIDDLKKEEIAIDTTLNAFLKELGL